MTSRRDLREVQKKAVKLRRRSDKIQRKKSKGTNRKRQVITNKRIFYHLEGKADREEGRRSAREGKTYKRYLSVKGPKDHKLQEKE